MNAHKNTLRIVAVLLAAISLASVWAVDINVPLTDSHYRPSGTPVPTIVLVAAVAARFVFLAAIVLLGVRRLSKPTRSQTMGDQ